MTRSLSHWTATGRVFVEDDGQLTWSGALGERNVPDASAAGGYVPHRWDGERLHYGGDWAVRVDGSDLVWEQAGEEVSRAELELRDAAGRALASTVAVRCEAGDLTEHGARLIIECEHDGEVCEHEIATNGSEWVTAGIRLTRGQRQQQRRVHRVAMLHRAHKDNWAVLCEQSELDTRTMRPGTKGRGILRTDKLPAKGEAAEAVAARAAEPVEKAVRDLRTDEPGGELEIEWMAEVAAAGIRPDTYGPATATIAGVYECGTGGVETEFQGAGSGYGTYLDESYNKQEQAGVVFWGVVYSGTVTAASLVMDRQNQNSGTNGTVGMRCEASNTPVEPLTNNPWGRTYRSAETQVTFPNSSATVTFDPTTNLNDLLAAGYTYTGGATQGVHFAFAGANKGWYNTGNVSWRSVCNGTSGTRPILTITYTPASGGVTVSGTSVCGQCVSSGTIATSVAGSGASVAGPAASGGTASVDTSAVGVSVCGSAVSSGAVSAPVAAVGASVCGSCQSSGAVAVDVAAVGGSVCAAAVSAGTATSSIAATGASVCEDAASMGDVATDISVTGSSVCGDVISAGYVEVASDVIEVSGASVCGPVVSSGAAAVLVAALAAAACGPAVSAGTAAVDVAASGASICGPAISTGEVITDDSVSVSGASICGDAVSTGDVAVDVAATGASVAGDFESSGFVGVTVEATGSSVCGTVISTGQIGGPLPSSVEGSSVCGPAVSGGAVAVDVAAVGSSVCGSAESFGFIGVSVSVDGASVCGPAISSGSVGIGLWSASARLTVRAPRFVRHAMAPRLTRTTRYR